MKIRILIRSLLFILAANCPCVRADPVTDWNSLALQTIKAERTPPPMAARNLAILHVGIFDACNGISQNYQPYLVTGKPPGAASKEAAIAAAARKILSGLHPSRQPLFDTAYTNQLANIPNGPGKNFGTAWGESVADIILTWRSLDGADTVVPYIPGSGPGVWVPTPPGFAPALLPNWPLVTPFAMTNATQFRPPPPPALDSAQWAYDYNLTRALGRSDSPTRSAEETAIAQFWADGSGTVSPPGHWNVIARDIAAQRGNTLDQNARLFAMLNIAEADAGIIAWDCKYAFNSWRPITAIQNGDTDGNPDTEAEPTWTPLLVTPPFPEYISGHSTFSGAAATVLAVFFESDQVSFTTSSEDLPGVSRSFDSFSAAAEEAGMSRLYGGIHFMSANRAGLESGAQLGSFVMSHYLRKQPGRSQRGN